jgi:DNA uptake protein ComE-like DNA-binding protein
VNAVAEHAVRLARELRIRSRQLAATDPRFATELRIGRPDLARTYDDGGLIDVNNAPPDVLAVLPGITAEVAEQVVAVREERDGFVSAEDLAAALSLAPHIVPEIAEYTVYLPPSPEIGLQP